MLDGPRKPFPIMNDTQTCTYVCNKLLRGEMSAIESYQQSLEAFDDAHHRDSLQLILEDHRKSAEALREHITAMDAKPDSESGVWGDLAQAVTGAASLLGRSPVLATLIQGEEHGISEYEEALNDPDVMDEIKVVFRDTLIPRLQKHIAVLEALHA